MNKTSHFFIKVILHACVTLTVNVRHITNYMFFWIWWAYSLN